MIGKMISLAVILIYSFNQACTPVRNSCLERPCQNGGRCSEAGGDSYNCDCRDGYCGHSCENETTYILFGNYTGILICQGDTVVKDFKVDEATICESKLVFNDGKIEALYWKSETIGPAILSEPAISILPSRTNGYPYYAGSGYLLTDSLVFWYNINISSNNTDVDTCFYVGIRN